MLLLCELSHFVTTLLLVAAGPSRGWGRGSWPPRTRDVWGPAVAQKYKVHQNAPFSKEKFKKFLPRGAPQNVWGAAKMFPRAPLWLSTGLRSCGSKFPILD